MQRIIDGHVSTKKNRTFGDGSVHRQRASGRVEDSHLRLADVTKVDPRVSNFSRNSHVHVGGKYRPKMRPRGLSVLKYVNRTRNQEINNYGGVDKMNLHPKYIKNLATQIAGMPLAVPDKLQSSGQEEKRGDEKRVFDKLDKQKQKVKSGAENSSTNIEREAGVLGVGATSFMSGDRARNMTKGTDMMAVEDSLQTDESKLVSGFMSVVNEE